jgi:DNA-directed RNA polymerase specialized sigma24 family protein
MENPVQTAFLEMIRAVPRLGESGSVRRFVGSVGSLVARRAVRPSSWWRLRARMPERSAAACGVSRTEQLRHLQAALFRLNADERVAFMLWALEGMDVASIARTMGASRSATRSRIFQAQQELAERAESDRCLRELLEGSRA